MKQNPIKPLKSFEAAEREFDAAWSDSSNTAFQFLPIDVNAVLSERYKPERPVNLTRRQLWDMELKKAWNPAKYIPYVVSTGESWGREWLDTTTERFLQSSVQKGWIVEKAGTVLEEVVVNHPTNQILFFGRQAFDRDGVALGADDFQPRFYVEHTAGGSEERPLNIWKIVLLTEGHDRRFITPFEEVQRAGWLPGFLEIYIRDDLKIALERRA
jgi:hypothetical protein